MEGPVKVQCDGIAAINNFTKCCAHRNKACCVCVCVCIRVTLKCDAHEKRKL